jgi:hypothetical protein
MAETVVPLVYLIFFLPIVAYFIRLLKQIKDPESPQRKMMAIGKENTQAVQENSALLKELIEINRKLLANQNEPKS